MTWRIINFVADTVLLVLVTLLTLRMLTGILALMASSTNFPLVVETAYFLVRTSLLKESVVDLIGWVALNVAALYGCAIAASIRLARL